VRDMGMLPTYCVLPRLQAGQMLAAACHCNGPIREGKDTIINTGRASSLLGRVAALITPHDQRIHHRDTFALRVDNDRVKIDRIDVVAVICRKMR
jgi:hypothetical protein